MPTTQVLMRNSERSTFRRCRQKWHWSYNLRLEPLQRKGALSFGTGVHYALERYYPPGVERGPHPTDTFVEWFDEQEQDFDQWDEEGNRVPARELGATMLEEYVKEYGDDSHIEILQPEMRVQVDIFDGKGKYLCTWVGTGDAVYVDRRLSRPGHRVIRMLEHKTAKSIEEELSIISGYGEQGLSYFWGVSYALRDSGLLAPGEQIDGVTFNWLRKALPDPRPRNAQGHALNKPTKDALVDACITNHLDVPKRATNEVLASLLRSVGVNPDLLGEVAKRQPGPLLHRFTMDYGPRELQAINARMRAEAWEMAQVRKGNLPIYKNPTKDCKWDCPFKEPCEIHEMGGDYKSALAFEFAEWEPYEGHELQEEKV